MPAQRDPLSVRYDAAARRVLLQAARAARGPAGSPRAVVTYVPSPAREFRDLDAGGRTRHERAFTRSLYYLVTKTGTRRWSLKLTWGNRSARGRQVQVRLFPYGSGYRHVQRHPGTAWWHDESRQSRQDNRVPAQR